MLHTTYVVQTVYKNSIGNDIYKFFDIATLSSYKWGDSQEDEAGKFKIYVIDFLTCWLTKGQQVISSAFFLFPPVSGFFQFPPFLSGGIANAKYKIQMDIAFLILYRTPSEPQTKVQTQSSNPNIDRTLTEPQPNLDGTSADLWPNLNRTST